ncbi:hypothetical protein [Clostridioides difficile]
MSVIVDYAHTPDALEMY